MKISIIIPIYNVAPYIKDCLKSVMKQSWMGELECVLVDDCGTDNSMALAEQMIENYHGGISFLIVRHSHNQGLSAARNSGIDAATGDYLYFLDSDDEITKNCIECLCRPLETSTYDVVVADYRIIGNTHPKSPLLLKDGEILLGKEILGAYRLHRWDMVSVNKLYRAKFLKYNRLRFREGIIHEDELWSFQVACLAQSLFAINTETYLYKIREGSITVQKNNERRCSSLNLILKEMCEFARQNSLDKDEDVHNLIQNFQMVMLYSIYGDAPKLLKEFYLRQRHEMRVQWVSCVSLNGTDMRKQFRDLHLLLPIPIALPYLKLLFHFM